MLDKASLKSLSLYHYPSCPFCAVTRQAMSGTELDIELRDIRKNPQHRSTLVQQGGKSQVPCLRIETTEGKVQWLYESADIIRFIQRYSHQAAAKLAS